MRSDDQLELDPVVRGSGRTSDRVFDELVSAIRDLRLLPGQSLSETDLAAALRVSRTPLREAIARLVDNGIVQVVPQVGTRVSLINMRDVEEAWFVRDALEVAAFEQACKIEVRDVSRLRKLLEEQREASREGNTDAFFRADQELHQEIFVLSGYAGAWEAVQRMKLQLDRLRRLSVPDPSVLDDFIAEHKEIVDALERGEAAVGRAHVRAHARRALDVAPELRRSHPNYFEGTTTGRRPPRDRSSLRRS